MMQPTEGPTPDKALASSVLAFLIFLLCLPAQSVEPAEPAEPPPTTVPEPEPYTRVARPDADTVQLEITRRRFTPAEGQGPDLWLVAVSHIGETNYFQTLQTFLDRQKLVLYEGVGDPQSMPESEEDTGEAGGLQATLAGSLGMAFQLDSIQYKRRHFKNSDMTYRQLEKLLRTEIQTRAEEGGTPNPAFVALMGAMDGSSWLGAVMHMGARLLGSSPKLKAMTRLIFIEILGGLKSDMSELQGVTPDMRDLLLVLIRERNKVVLEDLKKSLNQRRPPVSIAVFYGAGHMPDLEKRVRAELGYQPAEDVWLPAIVVHPSKAGLSNLEVNSIRTMVEWQMNSLQPKP